MTHPEPHDLTALAYGLIEGVERDSLLEHVAACEACREVYDSYRVEQAAVRDSILKDARSGAAEARALESTLRMLGAINADEKQAEEEAEERGGGRLIRMPYWLVALEVAAVLLVALGLFFILKPGSEVDEAGKMETVQVAEVDRAPADVEQGVAYVQDDSGDWKQADAVPVDEWIKTGGGTFAFTLSDGSRAELEPDSVFRIKLEDGREPVVYMLHGNGTIDTQGVERQTYVGAGDSGFYAQPGAKFELSCEGEPAPRPRTWDIPKSFRARVLQGKVMAMSDGELNYIPLQGGEQVSWNARDGIRFETDGAGHARLLHAAERDEDAMKQLELFIPRLEEWDRRWEGDQPEWKGSHEKRMKELRRELDTMRVLLKKRVGGIERIEDIEIEVTPDNGVRDTTVLVFGELGLTITLSSDGARLTVEVATPDGVTTHSAASLVKLREMLAPEIADLIEGVKTEIDDGELRIRGFDNTTGEEVRIEQRSHSRSTSRSED